MAFTPDETLLPRQPGPGEPVLAKQKHHHRKAFEHISKALKLDEDGNANGKIIVIPSVLFVTITNFSIDRKQQAIGLYKKGIQELQKGVDVEVKSGQGMHTCTVYTPVFHNSELPKNLKHFHYSAKCQSICYTYKL